MYPVPGLILTVNSVCVSNSRLVLERRLISPVLSLTKK